MRFDSFGALAEFARCVVASGFAPKGMEKVSSVVVAIQQGLEIGLPPMAALQNIAVINGRPSIFGDAALAVVRNSGLLESFEERPGLWCHICEQEIPGDGKCRGCLQTYKREDARSFICTAKRQGDKQPIVGGFNVFQAKTAGLWGKTGPWTQYPNRMLRFRARGWVLRDGFGDVLKGLRTAEEQQDMPGAQTIDAEPLPTGRVRISHANGSAQPSQAQESQTPIIDMQPETEPEPKIETAHVPEEQSSTTAAEDSDAGVLADLIDDIRSQITAAREAKDTRALADGPGVLLTKNQLILGDMHAELLKDYQQAFAEITAKPSGKKAKANV